MTFQNSNSSPNFIDPQASGLVPMVVEQSSVVKEPMIFILAY